MKDDCASEAFGQRSTLTRRTVSSESWRPHVTGRKPNPDPIHLDTDLPSEWAIPCHSLTGKAIERPHQRPKDALRQRHCLPARAAGSHRYAVVGGRHGSQEIAPAVPVPEVGDIFGKR